MTDDPARARAIMAEADPLQHLALDDSASSPSARALLDRILDSDGSELEPLPHARSRLPRYVGSALLVAAAGVATLIVGHRLALTTPTVPAQSSTSVSTRPAPAPAWIVQIGPDTIEIKGSAYLGRSTAAQVDPTHQQPDHHDPDDDVVQDVRATRVNSHGAPPSAHRIAWALLMVA